MIDFLRKHICSALLCALLLPCLFAYGGTVKARAASSVSFDETDVLEDLQSSDGFDLENYPYDSTGLVRHPQIFTVVEYCYTFRQADRGNYGLYIYFYNPQALRLVTSGKQNRITLGIAYSEGADGNVTVTDYEKFDLLFCSRSEGDYKDLFYKFKVVDHESADGKTLAERVNSNARRYDISEVELLTLGDVSATAYGVGGTYVFTGYAKGCGADTDAESTLSCDASSLETVELKLNSTFYRTGSSSAGKDHQNQIDSVYFGVDNSLLSKYGALQKVKAEWWEYKTAPIVVTQDKALYDAVLPFVGTDIGEHTDDLDYSLGRTIRHTVGDFGDRYYYFSWSYNFKNQVTSSLTVSSMDQCSMLPYIFYSGGSDVKDYSVSSARLRDWIYSYDKSHAGGYLPCKNGKISADLFADDVDEGRTKGYNCVEIDAGDSFDLLSYNSNHGFWDKVADYGFISSLLGKTPTDDNVYGIDPIYAVKDEDLNDSNAALAGSLFISESDAGTFRDYYAAAKASDQTVFLFRFAATDYFSGMLTAEKKGSDKFIDDKSYMAKETVFLDFDVIQLTFRKDEVYTVIPVVASPIDVIGGITPPSKWDMSLIWKIIFIVVIVILVVLGFVLLSPVLIPVLRLIIKGIVWLVTLPFKGIAALVEHIRSKRGK